MTEPFAIVQDVVRNAKTIASELGSHTLNESTPDLRVYDDGLIHLEMDLLSDNILIFVIDNQIWTSVFYTSEEDPLGTYRPDLPMQGGASWIEHLASLATAIPSSQSPLFSILKTIAGTPNAKVELFICQIQDLADMGVEAASWIIRLLQALLQLSPEKQIILLRLFDHAVSPQTTTKISN